jgi:hypothetical protein
MKKFLMGSTAVALAGLAASPASSAEWDVKVGGYMEQYLGYVDNDIDGEDGSDRDGIDSKQDAEIWFLPSITLDNGIKIGVNIQLEGNTGGDQIDESFLFIKGSFGEVILGNENSAGYKMTYSAPDVTFLNVNSGSLSFFVPFSGNVGGAQRGSDTFRRTLQTTFIENVGNNDAARFTYFTPRFAGFQVGASYARDSLQDTNLQIDRDNPPGGNASLAVSDIFDVGANYVQTFGDFDVAVSGRWGTARRPGAADPDIWSAGLNLGYAGFKIGGSYAEQNDADQVNGEAYDLGASYETGPWGFSVTWFHGENKDNENFSLAASSNPDEEMDQYLLGVSYTVAKGVVLNGYAAYLDFDEDVSDGGVGNGDDIEAYVIGTGIIVRF